jgi:hypothetical protein
MSGAAGRGRSSGLARCMRLQGLRVAFAQLEASAAAAHLVPLGHQRFS